MLTPTPYDRFYAVEVNSSFLVSYVIALSATTGLVLPVLLISLIILEILIRLNYYGYLCKLGTFYIDININIYMSTRNWLA